MLLLGYLLHYSLNSNHARSNFSVAISVSPRVSFILVLILISMFQR